MISADVFWTGKVIRMSEFKVGVPQGLLTREWLR